MNYLANLIHHAVERALNKRKRENWWHTWIARTEEYEKMFQYMMHQSFKKQKHEVLERFDELIGKQAVAICNKEVVTKLNGIEDLFNFNALRWNEETLKRVREELQTIIAMEGDEILAELVGGNSVFNVRAPFVTNFIEQWSLKLSFDIVRETEDLMKIRLEEGMALGWSMTQMRDSIAELFDDMSDYRAMRIARTETIRASNYAAEMAYIDSGVVQSKEWMCAEDERTCDYCLQMDGIIIDLGGNFVNRGGNVHAGGRSMNANYTAIRNPPLHPHCRCCLLPVIDIEAQQQVLRREEIDE